GGERRLAGAGATTDEEHDRQVELVERVQTPEPANGHRRLPGTEHVLRQLGEAVELEPFAVLDDLRLRTSRQLVRPRQRKPGRSERARHQTFRPRRPVVAAERELGQVAAFSHTASGSSAAAASSPRRAISYSSPGSPGSDTTSFATRTSSTPR